MSLPSLFLSTITEVVLGRRIKVILPVLSHLIFPKMLSLPPPEEDGGDDPGDGGGVGGGVGGGLSPQTTKGTALSMNNAKRTRNNGEIRLVSVPFISSITTEKLLKTFGLLRGKGITETSGFLGLKT